jgi:hypothetical protein
VFTIAGIASSGAGKEPSAGEIPSADELLDDPGDGYGEVSANPTPPFNPQTYDYSQSPGSGFESKGPKDKGSWFNPKTNEYVRKDFLTVGHEPHYDWRAPNGEMYRVYLDGTVELKVE